MRVLYLTHRLPYAPNRGDRIRAYHTLLALRAEGAVVDLVSLVHDDHEASQVSALQGLVDSVHIAPVNRFGNWMKAVGSLLTTAPLTHAFLNSRVVVPTLERLVAERRPDVVLALCSGMTRFALEPPLAGLPLVIDMVDVDSGKWQDLAGKTAPPKRWIYQREARCLAAFEAVAANTARATVVVNERERELLAALAPDAQLGVVEVGVDLTALTPPEAPVDSRDVVFCGVMNYEPNEQGALWMATEVWPLIRQRDPHARLRIVGANPTAAVQGLADAAQQIDVTGTVPDVRPYLWSGAVAVAPLLTARGVQNKVLEAVAAGLPCVVTPAVAAGLPGEIGPACTTAGSAAAFADAVVALLQRTPTERRRLAERVDFETMSWGRRLAPLMTLLREAAGPPRATTG